MKHLIIENFGPLKKADIELGLTNLIIGLQSSGKSCVMLVACYCSWVEKRIALRQSASDFKTHGVFIKRLTEYYHIKGYVRKDTNISYETEFMQFSYNNSSGIFRHRWKNLHWRYKRPKVSYIPAERNILSLLSNWSSLKTSYTNILDFKEDFDTARSFMQKEENILGLGVTYEYNAQTLEDVIITKDGNRVFLTDSSSGIQSLIPQFVHLDYLSSGIYKAEDTNRERYYSEKQSVYYMLEALYMKILKNSKGESESSTQPETVNVEGRDFTFNKKELAEKFIKESHFLLFTDHSEVFLEEPECNLFPTTQYHLMDWIVQMINDKKHRNFFFIATHSPYILTHLIHENLKNFKLFIPQPYRDGQYVVKTASEADIQELFDNGSDAFFNLDVFQD